MKAYIEGVIQMVEDASFKDAQTGKPVPYFAVYVQDGEKKVLKLGSREDRSDSVGKDVVITLSVRPDFNKPSLYRLTIDEIKES